MLVVQPTTGNYSTQDPKNSTITPSPHRLEAQWFVLLMKSGQGNQIKKCEMGRACGMHGL